MAKNPVEEFLSLEKTAAGPGLFRRAMNQVPGQMANAAAGAIAMGAVGFASAGIHAAVGSIVDAATKARDFKEMLHANEDLHEHYQQDPKRFNMMFNTLRTVNPQFSKDPLVAGSFMRRMIESPQGIGGIAGEALKQRADFPETAFGESLNFAREGAKAGLTDSLSGARMNQLESRRQNFATKDRELSTAERMRMELQKQQFERQQTAGRMKFETSRDRTKMKFDKDRDELRWKREEARDARRQANRP